MSSSALAQLLFGRGNFTGIEQHRAQQEPSLGQIVVFLKGAPKLDYCGLLVTLRQIRLGRINQSLGFSAHAASADTATAKRNTRTIECSVFMLLLFFRRADAYPY